MTGRQYQQLRENRRPRDARCVFGEGGERFGFLREAARSVKRRAQAQRIIEQTFPAGWLAEIRIESFEQGKLLIAVNNPAIRERIRRQTPSLERQMIHGIPGLRQLRVSLVGGEGAGET